MQSLPRLITFRPSHYCEKARWALDRAKIAYREEPHVPILSWAATYGAGAKRTVPALVGGNRVLPDSTGILRFADEQKGVEPLFPPDRPEAAALEEAFDEGLGPATRMIAYFHLMPHAARMKPLLLSAAKGWEAAVGRVLFPAIRGMIIRGLGINAEGAARARQVIDQTFARVAERLSDGRRYLTGERFTAADLTFAALAYPVLLPEKAERFTFPYSEVPASLRSIIEEFRATKAGQFGLRLWGEDRP